MNNKLAMNVSYNFMNNNSAVKLSYNFMINNLAMEKCILYFIVGCHTDHLAPPLPLAFPKT